MGEVTVLEEAGRATYRGKYLENRKIFSESVRIIFDFNFLLEEFRPHTQALAPSAMPPNQDTPLSWKKILTNFCEILFLIGFVQLFTTLFGAANAVSAISTATALLLCTKLNLGVKNWQAPLLIVFLFLVIPVGSHYSLIHPAAGIFINFSAIFLLVMGTCQEYNSKIYLPFVVCYIFSQGTPVEGKAFTYRVIGMAAGGILVAIVYLLCHLKRNSFPGIWALCCETHLSSEQIKFAFRLAFALSMGMLIGDLMDFPRTAWIGMTVNTLILPVQEDMRKRLIPRVGANFIGCAVFFLVFQILLPEHLFTIGLFLTSFFYMFARRYLWQQVFVAINAMVGGLVFFENSAPMTMRMRLMAVFIGVGVTLVTYVVNRYLQPFDRMDAWLQKRKQAPSSQTAKTTKQDRRDLAA